jgi:hypothetical protein
MTYTLEDAKKRLRDCNEEVTFFDVPGMLRVKQNREILAKENEDLLPGDNVLVKHKKRFTQAVLTSAPKDVVHRLHKKATTFRVVEYEENRRGTIYLVQAQTHNVAKLTKW